MLLWQSDAVDDLIGTQKPLRRLTDPAEAVAELERAVPGLSALRLPAPRSINWALMEADMGLVLPADYKLLCETHPAFELGDFLGFGGAEPGNEHSWRDEFRDELETIAEWCEQADMAVPLHPYPAPGGLLPWATSTQGDFFLWSTSAVDRGNWLVTVASRSGTWWHYEGGAVQFMAELVSGALEPWGLPEARPGVSPW
jgi:hypothetical protein